MTKQDPHREAGCRWNGNDGLKGSWFSILDWAVYHADGWQKWQAFRESMVRKSTTYKLERLYQWRRAHTSVQDLIRVMNYLRSMRGVWHNYPNMRDWHGALYSAYTYQLRSRPPEEDEEKCRGGCGYYVMSATRWEALADNERPRGSHRKAAAHKKCHACYAKDWRDTGENFPTPLSASDLSRLRAQVGVTHIG
jgi:hypothetical protein